MTIASPFTITNLAATLRGSIRGDVVCPDEPSFPAAVFGMSVDGGEPDLVVVAADADDVGTVVRLAARTGHRVVTEGSRSVRAGSILLVTRLLARVTVDQEAGTATIAAGASWRQLIASTAPLGLAPVTVDTDPAPGDRVDRLGTFCRRLGLSADHVLGFELVGPLGEPVHIDARRDPELFGSLRGAGWSGLITAVTIELFPAGPLYAGGLLFSTTDGSAVLDRWQRWSAGLPANCSTSARWLELPDVPQVPADVRGRSVLHIRFAQVGDPAEGSRLIAPSARSSRTPAGHRHRAAVVSRGRRCSAPVGRSNFVPAAGSASCLTVGRCRRGHPQVLVEERQDPLLGIGRRIVVVADAADLHQGGQRREHRDPVDEPMPAVRVLLDVVFDACTFQTQPDLCRRTLEADVAATVTGHHRADCRPAPRRGWPAAGRS